jgi:pimeloyl-ACP methyl ester carboxylesterase
MSHISSLIDLAKRSSLLAAAGIAMSLASLTPVAAAGSSDAMPLHEQAASAQTAITAPTRFVEVNGIRFAYRRFGKPGKLPLVFNQHLAGNLDNFDPAILDGFAKKREVIIFDNAGVGASTGEVPKTFAGMAANAEAFIGALGLKKVDLLGFSIGGMVAQQIAIDRPDLINKLILVGTAPRNLDAGGAPGHLAPEGVAIFNAKYDPPENLWLKVFFTDSEASQAAGREFLKRRAARTMDRDVQPNEKVAPAQMAAIAEWGDHPGQRFAYLKDIKSPTLIVSGTHDVIVYPDNSLFLAQNIPNAKLVLFPDANHGAWYQYHDEFVKEANNFLN